MLIPFLWVVATQIKRSNSVPVPNSTQTTQTTGWRPEPDTRGTLRLLTSCIVTLTLCVYTALHLNVPRKGATRTSLFLLNTRWVLMGMLAPEFVAYNAWSQWVSARELTATINQILEKQPGRRNPWTIVHSFYTEMGGFVFDTSDPNEEVFIQDSPRLAVTGGGMILLAEVSQAPDISEECILERSKADSLAKGIVCLQAGWLLLQCIGRVADRLPVTFLEVNTLAHVLCALAMYGFWWHKPTHIREPTPILSDSSRNLCAFMFMSSNRVPGFYHAEFYKILYTPSYHNLVERGEEDVVAANAGPRSHGSAAHNHSQSRFNATINQDYYEESVKCIPLPPQPTLPSTVVSLRNGQTLADTYFAPYPEHFKFFWMTIAEYEKKYPDRNIAYNAYQFGWSGSKVRVSPFIMIQLDQTGVTRWKLASVAIQKYPVLLSLYCEERYDRRRLPVDREFLQERIPNWSSGYMTHSRRNGWDFFCIGMASVAYGGLHLAAWNEFFPTSTERLLWRISALVVASSGFFFGALSPKPCYRALEIVLDPLGGLFGNLTIAFLAFLIIITFITYTLSRVFLIVESFISLRELPIDAYKCPDWSQYLSHF